MKLSSSKKTTILDKKNSLYELDSFNYEINNEFLKGKNVKIIESSKVPIEETNTYFFESGFFDLKNKVFNTGETKISLKKNIFDRSDNDPRLYGISSNHRDGITTVKKLLLQVVVKIINAHLGIWKLQKLSMIKIKNN